MTEFQTGPELESEEIVNQVREAMAKIFPDYKTLDRSRWDGYKPVDDGADNGRLLAFYLGEAEPSNPNIMFIFKKAGGFAVNFYNNPSFGDSETCISFRGSTVYKEPYLGDGNLWANNELEEACDQTRIWMEGLPLEKEILSQTVFDSRHWVVPFKEWLEEILEYKAAHKSKDQDPARLLPPDIFKIGIGIAKGLVIDRLDIQKELGLPFVMGGKEYSPDDILPEVNLESPLGKKALDLEIARVGIYYEILWQKGVTRPGKSNPLKLPN